MFLSVLFIHLLMTLSTSLSMPIGQVDEALDQHYDHYRETSINHRRFKHADIIPLIKKLKKDKYEVATVGKSVEGRDIYLIKLGTGKTKVLLWSQMHGDEPTATMALMDMFNFFNQRDSLDPIKNQILEQTTLYIIPMLNPDGAQEYTRRNAQDLDLNRDAIRLQSPEAQILKSVRDNLKPDFGFNLHDQNTRYSVGESGNPATISFLAPPYDHAKSVNDVRGKAMKMIVHLNNILQKYIPNQVAKYSDDHEPRAFGDNIQKWGTSTILIESGGYANDHEKQFIRKLNFIAIVSSLAAIADHSYEKAAIENYYTIPENGRSIFDLIVRNVFIEKDGQIFKSDIGINRYEENINNNTQFYYESKIEEVGDMSVFYGYEELDGEGLFAEEGKVYPKEVIDLNALQQLDPHEMLKKGYTSVKVLETQKGKKSSEYPLNIIKKSSKVSNAGMDYNAIPNFVLKKNGEVHYAIINGFIYDVLNNKSSVKNSIVF
ncbi:MAG: M14 family metallopeptidase [Bacteroidota bacterium]|nr:M14 family metallopeptidase [Bacteroidota bacterium]